MPQPLPVLGLFKDETELRDHIAARLSELEPGLVVTKTEYELGNPNGAGGRVDILALDEFDHIVAIELKRSNQSARSTLHELAKYISLLVREARVPREVIRCMVLSTDWHELLLPLSFFAATAGVHVEGIEVLREGNCLAYRPVQLTTISNLPQFSPEFSIYQYLTEVDRQQHLSSIQKRSAVAPFGRLAIVLLDAPHGSTEVSFRSIACLWRLRPEDEAQVPLVTGEPIGHLFPYAYPGWEAECDLLFWIADIERPCVFFSSADEERGTPEKVRNLFTRYRFVRVERYGDWPKVDLVNTDGRILRHIEAVSSLVSVERSNRYEFREITSPRFAPSWRHAVKNFLDFIAFEPVWSQEAEAFLKGVIDPRARVTLIAVDKNHFFYLLHQARSHPGAAMSNFVISVEVDGKAIDGLAGHWAWDQTTRPQDAEAAIKRLFGSVEWAKLAAFSAVDRNRYEQAVYDHGFKPVVYRITLGDKGEYRVTSVHGSVVEGTGLQDFVTANRSYVDAVSAIFADLPTAPPSQVK